MELYDQWKVRADQHDFELHSQNKLNAIKDPSCSICYPPHTQNIDEGFKQLFLTFWEYYQELCEAEKYTWKTMNHFGSLLLAEQTYNEHLQNENQESPEAQR